jgi:hypothetical protein
MAVVMLLCIRGACAGAYGMFEEVLNTPSDSDEVNMCFQPVGADSGTKFDVIALATCLLDGCPDDEIDELLWPNWETTFPGCLDGWVDELIKNFRASIASGNADEIALFAARLLSVAELEPGELVYGNGERCETDACAIRMARSIFE